MAKFSCPQCGYSTQVSAKMTEHYEATRHNRPPKHSRVGMMTMGKKPSKRDK